jgi:hypothetical protein
MTELKSFDKFVNENYYTPGKSEQKTQKIIFPVDEYEIGEKVQVSIYSEHKRKGEIGEIIPTTKFTEDKEVNILFKDGKDDMLAITDISRVA